MNVVKVGVGLYIINEKNELLLGLRKSPHGSGTWCPPGGHLEFGENFEEAAIREAKEETDLDVKVEDVKVISCTNDLYKETNKHYITIQMLAKKFSGKVKISEPNKWERWEWFSKKDMPENLFLSTYNFLKEVDIFTK